MTASPLPSGVSRPPALRFGPGGQGRGTQDLVNLTLIGVMVRRDPFPELPTHGHPFG